MENEDPALVWVKARLTFLHRGGRFNPGTAGTLVSMLRDVWNIEATVVPETLTFTRKDTV